MKPIRFVSAVVVLVCASSAHAQEATVEGAGYKVGEGTVLHPSVGAETGFISNVFYEDVDPISSGILRIIADLSIASLPPQRMGQSDGDDEDGGNPGTPPKIEFRAGARFTYNEYLTSNEAAKAQRDVGIGAHARAVFFPAGRISFGIEDKFVRDTRPLNDEGTGNLNRDINHLKLWLQMRPGGGTITVTTRYENRWDVFEQDDLGFANRMHHIIGLRANWQFLPITNFWADISQGFFRPYGDNTLEGEPFKFSSNPFRGQLGASSALTERTTATLWLGYSLADYDQGPGFNGVIFGASAGWRYAPFGRLLLGYEHDFRDSVNSNFYQDEFLFARVEQQISAVTVTNKLGLRFRTYEGIPEQIEGNSPNRSDVIVTNDLAVNYYYRDWLAVTAEYLFASDSTDFRYTVGGAGGAEDDPSFVRHELTIGASAAF